MLVVHSFALTGDPIPKKPFKLSSNANVTHYTIDQEAVVVPITWKDNTENSEDFETVMNFIRSIFSRDDPLGLVCIPDCILPPIHLLF